MRDKIIKIYDQIVGGKLPICVLQIIDDLLFFTDFKNYYSGLEFYNNFLILERNFFEGIKKNVNDQIENPDDLWLHFIFANERNYRAVDF